MKLIAFFLLFVVAFASAQNTTVIFSNLLTDLTVTELVADNGSNMLNYTQSASQLVTITVLTDGSVAPYICLSEYGTINSQNCSMEGYIAPSGGDDTEVDFYGQEGGAKRSLLLRSLMDDGSSSYSQTVSLNGLRYNTAYYVSAWVDDIPDSGNETVTIIVSWLGCPANNNNYGPNCNQFPANKIPESGAVTNPQALSPNGTLFTYDVSNTSVNSVVFSFVATVGNGALLGASNSNSSVLSAFIRRSALPVVFNGTWNPVVGADTFTSQQINNTYTFTVVAPAEGTWFIFVLPNNESESVTVTAQSATSSCSEGTYPVGTNSCTIASSIGGDTFTNTSIPANGTAFTQGFAANANGIAYYVWTTSNLIIGVANSESGDDAPYIYASYTGLPLSLDAPFSSTGSGETNFINVETEAPVAWVIAVTYPAGSSYTQFLLWAGNACANNCSAHGAINEDYGGYCNTNEGVCNCANGYNGYDCSGTKLKTVYIVLIAIGGAIVLAIAIGVPIGCYIKNRKRARYERV